MSELALRNRQRTRRINTPLLRRIVRILLEDVVGAGEYNVCVHIVAEEKMTRINRQFLRHKGSTDVITFDHIDALKSRATTKRCPPELHGEIFVCIDEAIGQARRFHTSWQSEIVRYVIHGVLHLLGYEDRYPSARTKMKREENRVLRLVSEKVVLSHLAGASRRQ